MDRILLIDGQDNVRLRVRSVLTRAGFDVVESASGRAGLHAARLSRFDLIIHELDLPDGTGEYLLLRLMAGPAPSPVVILSDAREESRRIAVLLGGAVDFVAKPAADAELVARVRLRIRDGHRTRMSRSLAPGKVRDTSLLDANHRVLAVGDRRVPLSNREFLLLQYLLEHEGRVCSRAEILRHAWDTPVDPGSNVVDVIVGRVRAKATEFTIETVRTAGYRLVA
jgi:DNA-binding response OmpR family regulator